MTKAVDFLTKAADLMTERGKQYDQPEGERSMGKAVAAFNIVTGQSLSEAEGWLLLQILKDVRQWQRPEYHADSAEDCVAYAALKAEALHGASVAAIDPCLLGAGGDHTLAEKPPALRPAPVSPDEAPTLLPDGSAFAVMTFPLPEDHWLYAPRQYDDGADEPSELPQPILSHAEHRHAVTAAVRYAVRSATNCGAEPDFDPDALVQNAVYALCGPFTRPQSVDPAAARPNEQRRAEVEDIVIWPPEERIDVIGQNGPTAEHYDAPCVPCRMHETNPGMFAECREHKA